MRFLFTALKYENCILLYRVQHEPVSGDGSYISSIASTAIEAFPNVWISIPYYSMAWYSDWVTRHVKSLSCEPLLSLRPKIIMQSKLPKCASQMVGIGFKNRSMQYVVPYYTAWLCCWLFSPWQEECIPIQCNNMKKEPLSILTCPKSIVRLTSLYLIPRDKGGDCHHFSEPSIACSGGWCLDGSSVLHMSQT